jgi:hypothetical protein
MYWLKEIEDDEMFVGEREMFSSVPQDLRDVLKGVGIKKSVYSTEESGYYEVHPAYSLSGKGIFLMVYFHTEDNRARFIVSDKLRNSELIKSLVRVQDKGHLTLDNMENLYQQAKKNGELKLYAGRNTFIITEAEDDEMFTGEREQFGLSEDPIMELVSHITRSEYPDGFAMYRIESVDPDIDEITIAFNGDGELDYLSYTNSSYGDVKSQSLFKAFKSMKDAGELSKSYLDYLTDYFLYTKPKLHEAEDNE